MESTPRKTSRRLLGDRGETIACQWYLDHGYEIIDRNVAISRVGEIDVIVQLSAGHKTEIVFAEVKTRTDSRAGHGYEAISYEKRVRMRNTAMAWIGDNVDHIHQRISWRLDVVSIDMSNNPPLVRVFENIEI
ncbi:MAG TPA: YraN family protein [Acidimicrobiia bacterium]|nr:YraN family protein [Acidimicrobiia bacterium]